MTKEVNKVESVTRSLRIAADKAEQYDKIRELFNNAGEFTDWVIEAYRLHESRQTSDLFKQDTKAIMDMFQSIFGVIGGVVSRAEGMVQSKDAEIVEELRAKDELAEDLRAELKALQDIISEKDEEIKTQKDKVKEVEANLKDIESALKALQEQFKDTKELNTMLQGEKVKYQAVEEANKQLAIDNSQLKESLVEVQKQANEGVQRSNELQREIESLIEKHEDKIRSIETSNRQALEHVEALKEVEISKAVLKAKEEAQAKIEEHLSKEEELRNKIDNLQETISVYSVSEINKDKEIARLKEELIKTSVADNKEKVTGTKKNKASKAKAQAEVEAEIEKI